MSQLREEALDLRGLHPRPSQVLRSVRLVPLCRAPAGSPPGEGAPAREDLRLYARAYGADPDSTVGVVDLGKAAYVSYIPHGLVLSYTEDGSPAAALGAALIQGERGHGHGRARPPRQVALHHRMVKREGDGVLRFLPLHLAMEGFLSLCFGGPDIAWSAYSRQALRDGLSPRTERSVSGRGLPDLSDALRVFELHDDQCGMLLFVGEALASAFVVPRPADYRMLHRTLLCDLFGETLVYYGRYQRMAPDGGVRLPERVADAAELRQALLSARTAWAAAPLGLADGVIGRPAPMETVYRAGPFLLQRFVTDLDLARDNHLGERIIHAGDGTVQYLKTYRLSDRQTRRAYLLQRLSRSDWDLDQTAAVLSTTKAQLIQRLIGAGFGYLLHESLVRGYVKGPVSGSRKAGS